MKNILGCILIMLTSIANAGNWSVTLDQFNSTGTSTFTRTLTSPASPANGLLRYNASTNIPDWVVLGNLTITSGVINAPQADWAAVSGNNVVLNKPATFPPSTHTHTAAQISDASTIGKSILSAADAAAIRVIIGSGTSSFSGHYGDLSDRPFIATDTSDMTNGAGFLTSSTGVTPSSMTTAISDLVTNDDMSDALSNYSTNTELASGLSSKIDIPSGTIFQQMLGNGTLGTIKTSLGQYINDVGFITGVSWADITSKPLFGTASLIDVATSGDASSLQAVKGSDSRLSDARAPTSHTHPFYAITATPTTLAGYGITDADSSGSADAAKAFSIQRANHTGIQSADTITDGTTNKAYSAAEKTKLSGIAVGATANDTDANLKNRANHTGTQLLSTISNAGTAAGLNVSASGNAASGEVVKGNDTRLATVYSGSTDSSGNYTITYGSAYSTKPKLLFAVEGGTNKDTSVLSATSTTGFTIKVERRTDVLGLLPSYANVVGAVVNVSVTQ